MVRAIGGFLVVLSLISATAAPAPAQVRRAAIGAGLGLVGGTAVTLAAIVARARFQQEYIDSVDDLIHWQSVPMIAAPAAGVLFGLAGNEALEGSVIGSTAGLVFGAATGATVGWLLSTQQEAPWAGGVIGAGLGMTLGGIGGGLFEWSRDESSDLPFPRALRFAISIPAP